MPERTIMIFPKFSNMEFYERRATHVSCISPII